MGLNVHLSEYQCCKKGNSKIILIPFLVTQGSVILVNTAYHDQQKHVWFGGGDLNHLQDIWPI